MNILIIENEKPAADRLNRLLNKMEETIRICDVLETVEDSVNWLQNNPAPDLIMMDIQLDDGLCFEIFEITDITIPVIFTTAFDEYMLRAFRVNSIDYLLKPVEEDALRQAIHKFKKLHFNPGETLKQILSGFNDQFRSRFLVKSGSRFRSVRLDEISCFYIRERAVFIRTVAGKEYSMDNSLDYYQKIIDPRKFFRINRDCIINIGVISEMISYSSSRLILKPADKLCLPEEKFLVVSRDKVGDFKKWIDR